MIIFMNPIAHIKTAPYLWGTTCAIILNRFRVPLLLGVIGNLQKVRHVVTPHSVGTLKSVQKSATDRQKAKVLAMSYQQKNPVNVLTVTNWSMIFMFYAIGMPVHGRDAKRDSKSKIRLSLFLFFRNTHKIMGRPFFAWN